MSDVHLGVHTVGQARIQHHEGGGGRQSAIHLQKCNGLGSTVGYNECVLCVSRLDDQTHNKGILLSTHDDKLFSERNSSYLTMVKTKMIQNIMEDSDKNFSISSG